MALTRAQIQTAFQNSLGRAASTNEENSYFSVSQSGALADGAVIASISNSREADLNADPVVRFYQAAFGRVPDQAGLDNATDYVRSFGATAQTYQTLANQFVTSTEFTNRFGTGTTVDAAYVTALYSTILGRTPSGAEVDGYTSGSNGFTTRGQVLYAISQSQEAIGLSNTAVNTFLNNAAQGTAVYTGTLYTTGNGQPNNPSNAVGPLTVNSDTVNGTTGIDTLDGSRFVSTAGTFINTLNNADSIDLGAGSDTFNVQVNGAVTPASVKGVETLNVESYTGQAQIDLINGDANLQTVSYQNSGALGTQLTNVQGRVATLNLNNLSGGAQTLGVTTALLAGTADALQVNVNNVTGAGTLNVGAQTGNNGYETINLASNGSVANNIGTINAGALSTLNVTGSQNLTVTANGAALATVNASTLTGNLNITTGAANLAQTITGGGGADRINIAGTYTNADVINGGLGTDVLVVNNAEATAALIPQTNVTGIETLGVSDGLSGTVTVNNFNATGLQLNANIAGNSVVNYAAGTNLLDFQNFDTANNETLTVNVAGVGTTDVLNITAGTTASGNGVVTGTGAFTFNGAETVNITTAGAASTFGGAFTLTPTAANEQLNVSGSQSVTFTGVVTADTINATGLTGTAALTLTGGTAAQAVSVTSAGGADRLITGTANDLLSSGAGNDFLNGAGGADALTGGADNDTFRFSTRAETRAGFNAADTTTANIDKITDFVGNGNAAGDTIELGTGANAFGAAITFTGATVANVTAVTVATAADFTALAAAVEAQSAGVASVAGTARIYDVTVTGGNLAGRYAIINDDTAAVAATDTIISVTGINGALNAQDFTFVA